MLKRSLTVAATAVAALSLVALTTSPAHASTTGYRGCSTTGASGGYAYSNYHGPGATINVSFDLSDTLADGYHARVRFLSKNTHGTTKYWGWRQNLDGAGTTKYWVSTASDTSGLFDIGVQIARFNGSTLLNSCTDWT